MAVLLAQISTFLAVIPLGHSISCLVVRPGYGLVSEQCPTSAVGCRIRVLSDRIDWYEWAKLYDRNQLVCVYPEEYRNESGCQKKASGSVRCWCGGKDDCNDAENSRNLYETHIGPLNHKKTELASNRILTTTRATTTTAAATTTTRRSTTIKKTTPKTTRRTPTTAIGTTTTKTTTTTTIPRTTTTEKIFQEVNARPLPTDDRDKYDEIFDATRKALEAQMKEEDERLQQMLMDEEDEMDEDEEKDEEEEKETTPVVTTPSEEDKMRHERRERARMEERRRQEEEERLARIEREEAEAAEKRKEELEEEEEEDYEYEGGAGLMSSTSIPNLLTATVILLLR